MKKTIQVIVLASAITCGAVLPGCASIGKAEPSTLFDLGPDRARATPVGMPALPPLSIAEIRIPAWLDSNMMFYRLNYTSGQQPRPYAQARWTMTPAQLLSQRIKARITQAGGVALSASDGAMDVPVLRMEADDFTQSFDAPGTSTGQVHLRVSVFKGRNLVAQKSFAQQAPAPTADAAGGAVALANASDAVIGEMILWLASLSLK